MQSCAMQSCHAESKLRAVRKLVYGCQGKKRKQEWPIGELPFEVKTKDQDVRRS